MSILFKNNINIKNLKQSLYNIFLKDYKTFDKIVNSLKNIRVIKNIPLKKPFLAFFLIFLIWYNRKE